jgi:hypothetical protein
MIEITGDIWHYWNQNEWVCVTTNGIVKNDGAAVMGAGVALQAAEQFPGLPRQLAWKLKTFGNHVYAFLPYRVFTFPTKHDWKDPSKVELILQSCAELRQMSAGKVYLPRPGCSNGGLDWNEVKPLMQAALPEDWFIVVSLPGE